MYIVQCNRTRMTYNMKMYTTAGNIVKNLSSQGEMGRRNIVQQPQPCKYKTFTIFRCSSCMTSLIQISKRYKAYVQWNSEPEMIFTPNIFFRRRLQSSI